MFLTYFHQLHFTPPDGISVNLSCPGRGAQWGANLNQNIKSINLLYCLFSGKEKDYYSIKINRRYNN